MQGLIVDYAGVLDGPAEEIDGWRALFAALKEKEISLAILSNDPGGSDAEPIREWEYRGVVDAVVLSGEIGVEKPEPGAFQAAADALGLDVKECVMIDDNIYNVQASIGTGMVGILHTAFERTAVEIQAIFEIEGEF